MDLPWRIFRLKAEATDRKVDPDPNLKAGTRHACCWNGVVVHPYPRHHPDLPYVGRQRYFLTFCTEDRQQVFLDPTIVLQVRTQFLRAGAERSVALIAYCFMPDHVHLILHGTNETSDCKAFIKASKQYSGFCFKKERERRLWQRYSYERVLRDDRELALTIGYIVTNPVRAGLVEDPRDYPHLGSEWYTVEELLMMCEYRKT